MRRLALLAALPFVATVLAQAESHRPPAGPAVTLWRLPAGAIQPQAAIDGVGAVHLIYFRGDSQGGSGNLYYVKLAPGEAKPGAEVRVNSRENTAGCIGTVRAAHVAIGQGDRVHVVWNGLGPKGANGYPTTYVAYTRLDDSGRAFEPQRNLITWAGGLDGGSSVAADPSGNVYAVWHATAGARDETGRAVYVAHSSDNGKTFARERQANPLATGACGCCGLRAMADHDGTLSILYRAAGNRVHRDTMLLTSRDHGQSFKETLLDPWQIDACPMSTYALATSASGVMAAWETRERIYWAPVTALASKRPVDSGQDQKHPTIAANAAGQVLVAWTEGTGWQRGGSLFWQVYDRTGQPVGSEGHADGVPVWGLASAYARPDGSFVVVF